MRCYEAIYTMVHLFYIIYIFYVMYVTYDINCKFTFDNLLSCSTGSARARLLALPPSTSQVYLSRLVQQESTMKKDGRRAG